MSDRTGREEMPSKTAVCAAVRQVQHIAGEFGAGHRLRRNDAAVLGKIAPGAAECASAPWTTGRCRRHHLLERERECLGCRIIGARGRHQRRAGLVVPERELAKVATARVLEALHEILDGGGLAVMALEIEIHALLEQFAPEQGRDHAGDFAALFIDGRRVEVVDLAVFRRAHRVGERARHPPGTARTSGAAPRRCA